MKFPNQYTCICWGLDHDANLSMEEFNKILRKAKISKLAPDVISIELLKHSSSTKLKPEILRILEHCWDTAEIPDAILQLTMCSIFKSGDKKQCKNQ